MMADQTAIMLALDAKIEDASAGLGLTTIKGYPALRRGALSKPNVAIWWVRDEPRPAKTVGRTRHSYWATTFQIRLTASDEPTLLTYVNSFGEMLRDWTKDTINSKQMEIMAESLERLTPGIETTDDERYSAEASITFEYER